MPGPWEKYQQPNLGRPIIHEAPPQPTPRHPEQRRKDELDASITAATAPSDICKKQADAQKAEIDLANLEKTGGASVEEAKAGGFYSRALKANDIYQGMGVGAPGLGREAAKAVLPDSWVNQFTPANRQQAEAAQRDFIMATLRYESGAAIPPEELESQRKVYFPEPGDAPSTVELKAKLRQNAIEALKIGAGVAADRVSPALAGDGKPTVAPATGKVAAEFDAKTSAAVDRMIRMRRPYREIAAFAKSKGYVPPDEGAIQAAVAYLQQNPKYKGGFTRATKSRETSLLERVAGGPVGGYLGGAATALTAGFNDEAAGLVNAASGGSYEEGRDAFNAKKSLIAGANPEADFAGTLAGNVLALYGGGKAAQGLAGGGSKIGGALSAKGGIGLDTAYGAAYGAGQNNENRAQGAFLGGLAAAGGNIAGQGLTKAVGGLVSPSGGRLRPLYDLGVRPSIGQRAGGVVNAAEERFQSIPLVGDAIAGTRQRARDQFQVGLFNDALGEIGRQLPPGMTPGNRPHAFAQKAFSEAYGSAQSNMVAAVDGEMSQAIGVLQQKVAALRPGSQAQFNKVWRDSVARRFEAGALKGEGYKRAMSELGKKSASIRKNQTGDGELADALDEAQAMIRDSAMRNSSPEAVARLDAVDRGYAKLVRIEDAARRRGTGSGKFSPKQYDAAVQNTSGGVRSRGYLAGDALNSDLATLGLNLGDEVPNSASFDRAAWAAGVGGLGILEPSSLGAFGLLGAVNAPGVRNFTTGLMAPRVSPTLQDAAKQIRKRAPLIGSVGAGTGLALLPQR